MIKKILLKLGDICSGIMILIKDFLKYIYHKKHINKCPINRRSDDIFFVSFPKSGATWINFLCANVNNLKSTNPVSINFYNLHQHIPDINDTRDTPSQPISNFPGFRMIKSHASYNPYYKFVVYIVRDPRDVMVSYYHFLLALGHYEGTISQMIRSKVYGINAWVNHVEGWFSESPASLSFIYVKYEDLISNSEIELKRMYGFFGFNLDKKTLDLANSNSEFDNMKKLEKELNYGGREVGADFHFVRTGKSDYSKNRIILSQQDEDYIISKARSTMDLFGYQYEYNNPYN